MAASPRTAIAATLLGDLAMSLAKFIAAALTGSPALLAEAVHSIASAGSQGLLLIGIRLSRASPADGSSFGLARERYFWGSTAVFAIFAVGGAFAVHAGLVVLLGGGVACRSPAAAYGVLAIAGVFAVVSTHGTLRQYVPGLRGRSFREVFFESKDPTVVMTLVEDATGFLGVVVALFGVALGQSTGSGAPEAAAALVIGLFLASRATLTALKAKRMLLGQAASAADQEKVRRILALQPGIEKVNDVTAVHLAPHDVLLGLSLDFRPDVGAEEVRRIVYSLEYRIREALPHMKRVYIEAGTVVRSWERAADRKTGSG
ncbi:MAG: cation diffusion facilitator family transporter [Deltaproteobacteria bacterium]|nr:cation diffusion facilitator family transporter [Deltaproteobacteria bacterium]